MTGLRFVLAVWVVLHHISGRNMMLEGFISGLPLAAQSLIHGGYLAVQTFFILSGFVLARAYLRSSWTREDLIRYAAARVARIYPVYLLSLAVVSPFIMETMFRPGRSGAAKIGLLADYGLLLQGWTDGHGVGWNTPAWTLSCEFFFYLFFPLLLLSMRKAGPGKVLLIFGGCVVTPVLLAHADVPWTWKPIHHLSDFAAGIAAAKIFGWLEKRMAGKGFWLYVPALLGGALVIINPKLMEGTYGDVNTALRPLNVLTLIGLALGGGGFARALSSKAAEYLGKASYSLYILHVPVLWWYSNWAMKGSWHMSGTVATGLYFVLIIAASSLAFRFVEVPANRFIRNRVQSRFRKPEPISLPAAA